MKQYSIRKWFYKKILPEKIKEHISNPYYKQFIVLEPKKRTELLNKKNVPKIVQIIIIQYCYIYCLL
jgi:hypothetical protein